MIIHHWMRQIYASEKNWCVYVVTPSSDFLMYGYLLIISLRAKPELFFKKCSKLTKTCISLKGNLCAEFLVLSRKMNNPSARF
jgi:hypothetical protein